MGNWKMIEDGGDIIEIENTRVNVEIPTNENILPVCLFYFSDQIKNILVLQKYSRLLA
jgi:hypothetical protein